MKERWEYVPEGKGTWLDVSPVSAGGCSSAASLDAWMRASEAKWGMNLGRLSAIVDHAVRGLDVDGGNATGRWSNGDAPRFRTSFGDF